MKAKGFSLKKIGSRWYPEEILTYTHYADKLTLFANTPAKAESLLYSMEQGTKDIGLYVKSDKTVCCNRYT